MSFVTCDAFQRHCVISVGNHAFRSSKLVAFRSKECFRQNKARSTRCSDRTIASVVASEAPSASVFTELSSGSDRKYIMISGKGGVGKTSLSASLAIQFAQAGHTTLIVSTDPAHSLGDSLAQDIGGGAPVLVEGTDLPLWALEIDPEKEKEKFRAYTSGAGKKDAEQVLGGFGLTGILEQLSDLKLSELLDTPPPGFDEAVAIAKVQQFVQNEEYARFSRIVFDTAPTGHTLRLLTVPDFVEASLAKIVRLRRKLSSASAAVKGLFGAGGDGQDAAAEKLEKLQESITMVKDLFRDRESTEFIIATIPTVLGISESSRLASSLKKESIPCKRIIVNQVITPEMGEKYLSLKLKDQAKAIEIIEHDPALVELKKLRGPYLDLEVRGVPALQYFGRVVWGESIDAFASSSRKYFMLGGKGGVGKTSCSASLAISLANAGHTTLVVSTDPAHSLSDALDQDVSGGRPVPVSGTDEKVYGMEIDLEAARQDLRDLVGADGGKGLDNALGSVGLGGIADQLKDLRLGELLETPPPGIDEAVAIAKVVQFLKDPEYAKFTRIVFDTAPTGHTLRMLALPDFLDTSVGKLLRLRQKVTSLTDSVKGIFTGGNSKPNASEKLDAFRDRMAETRALFHDQELTGFVIVTIPTIMAATESARLAAALRQQGIPLDTLVVNQVVNENVKEQFLSTRRKDQQRAMQMLREDPALAELQLIEAPLFDLEVRGVPALQYFGKQVWN